MAPTAVCQDRAALPSTQRGSRVVLFSDITVWEKNEFSIIDTCTECSCLGHLLRWVRKETWICSKADYLKYSICSGCSVMVRVNSLSQVLGYGLKYFLSSGVFQTGPHSYQEVLVWGRGGGQWERQLWTGCQHSSLLWTNPTSHYSSTKQRDALPPVLTSGNTDHGRLVP